MLARSGFSVFLSILLIVCGFLAILLPIEMSFGVVIVISWLLMFSGVLQFIHVFRCKGIGHALWKALIAFLYLMVGISLRVNPGLGVVTLTLVLIAFFVGQGFVDIFTYMSIRKRRGSGWLLLEGVITLVLGLMIWRHWPNGSLWVIGTLVGINMIMTGVTRLMVTLALRRVENEMLRAA